MKNKYLSSFFLVICFIVTVILYTGCSNNERNMTRDNQKASKNDETQNSVQQTQNSSPSNSQSNITPDDISRKIYNYILNLNKETMVDQVNKWASIEYFEQNGFFANCIKAKKVDKSLPDVLLMNFSIQMHSSCGYALYWWEDNDLNFQVFPVDNNLENDFSDFMTLLSARVSKEGNNAIELGVIFDSLGYGNGGNAKPRPVFKLLKLKDRKWEVPWSSPNEEQPSDKWQNNRGSITFLKSDISAFMLEGDSLGYADGKEKILAQTKSGRLRYIKQTWIKYGDKYILKESKFAPSAFNTLIEFVYSISTGKEDSALQYITDRKLIEKAKTFNMVQKSLDKEWWVVYPQNVSDAQEMRKQTSLTIVLDSKKHIGLKVNFINKTGGKFLISDLNKTNF